MRHLDTMEQGGYPFDDISIAYLQQMHDDRDSFIHAIFGDDKILQGLIFNPATNSYSDGLITTNGKLYHFVGGASNQKISKITLETKRAYEDGNQKKAFINEFYQFGSNGADVVDFSTLKRVKNLPELMEDENLVNVDPEWAGIKNKPIFLTQKIFGIVHLGDTSASSPIVSGSITSAQVLDTGSADERIRFNFASIGTSQYVPNVVLISKGSNYNQDNDVILTLKNLTSSSFEILLREIGSALQNLEFRVQIIL